LFGGGRRLLDELSPAACHGELRIEPNAIASPHNSAQSEGAHDIGFCHCPQVR
jgi:hypothetical protein